MDDPVQKFREDTIKLLRKLENDMDYLKEDVSKIVSLVRKIEESEKSSIRRRVNFALGISIFAAGIVLGQVILALIGN